MSMLGGIGIALAASVLLALAIAPVSAKASDLDFGWVDTGFYESYAPSFDSYNDFGWVDTGYYDTYQPSYENYDDYGWVDTGYYDTYEPSYETYDDYGWVDTGYYDTYEPSYDYGYDSDYSYGGYTGGGYSGGGYSGGGSTYYPSYPSYPTYRPQPDYNYNHCVNNSCNTNVNTRIDIREAQPYVGYHQPIYPVYNHDVCVNLAGIQTTAPIGYYTHAGHCVVATNYQQPYISLSSVPYTGLELGPVGTALYWGFLVLWCLLAAYLIAVKKVQNKIVAGLNSFLFPAAAPASHAHAPAKHIDTTVSHAKHGDEIDSFIQSQINRSR